VGYSDADIQPEGIDAAYEPFWANPYAPPEIPGKAGPGSPEENAPSREEERR